MNLNSILALLLFILPYGVLAQNEGSEQRRWGFTLNSSMNGELYSLRVIPSISYGSKTHQFELGGGAAPFTASGEKLYGADANYKFYPNGNDKSFNLFLATSLSYIHRNVDSYFPTTYNYLFVSGGYGLEIKLSEHLFMGTSIGYGVYTFSKKSDIPYEAFSVKAFGSQISDHMTIQFNLGYRF